MITIYTSPSCLSCRKVKKYFNDNNIKFNEKNIFTNRLTREDIMKMLINSENGFEDIISLRSKVFKELNVDIEAMNLQELITFIIDHPSILKRPIIVTDKDIQVGYNEEDITLFLPPEIRHCPFSGCLGTSSCEYDKNLKIEK